MGPLGAIFGLSAVAGPLLGGFFVDHLTWEWAFYINIPIGIAAFTIAWFTLTLPNKKAEKRIDIARRGAAVRRHHLPDLLHRLRRQEGPGLGLAADLAVRRRPAGRGCRLRPGRAPRRGPHHPAVACSATAIFVNATAIGFTLGLGMFAAIAFVPTFLQMSSGTSAAESGLLMLPMMVGLMGTAICSGIAHHQDRQDTRCSRSPVPA